MPVWSVLEHLIAQRYWMQSGADEIHRVRCTDGVRVAVKRFHPVEGSPTRRHPVLCLPGLGADSHNFDAPAPNGFASWLAEKGFDTWVTDPRGTGMSDVDPERWSSITFDDFALIDVACTLEHIAEVTGSDTVHCVGHSMGGMIIYAILGASGAAARVRSAITICSPVGFATGLHFPRFVRPLIKAGHNVPFAGVHVGKWLKVAAPILLRRGTLPLTSQLASADNLDAGYMRRVAHRAVQNVPRGVLLQFRDWVTRDRFVSADGRVDYRARLAGVTTPTLVVAAPEDKMATPRSVLRAQDLLVRSEVLLCGQRQGFSCDYGHIDVIFGRRAHDEVFPRLLGFLAEQDGDRAPVAASLGSARVH